MPVFLCYGPTDKLDKGQVWSLGMQWPTPDLDRLSAFGAEGAELELIFQHITNLPYTDHWLQVWFGDMAKFLARAMPGLPGVVSPNPVKHQPAGRRTK